uniref:Zinc finger, FYVE domain containing 27 n=1 Tax=Cyclopterus lumpus TaxID=8103 RepID=A0A8C2Z4D5_CYCLU
MPLCSLLVCMFLNVFFCTTLESFINLLLCANCSQCLFIHIFLLTVLVVFTRLKHMDDLLSSACLSAETFYKVLYWDNHTKSSRFYGGMLTLVCLLYITPLGWVLAVLNSAIFLWNRDFCRVLLDLRNLLHMGQASEGKCAERGPGHLLDRTPTPTSLEDLSPGSVEEAEEAEPDDEFKDAIEEDDDGPLGAPEYDTVSENGLLSRNEPIRSKVSKLTEKLRKRYPTTSTGQSALTHPLSQIAALNSFCSRCCSFKVLRSCHGATAPEAQRETVFVCAACNSSLIKL